MSSVSPPRDRLPRSLSIARGTLRDGLGALGNLAILASSVRVGSRAIAGVLPDVLSSCGPMRVAVAELVAGAELSPAAAAAAAQLQAFFDTHLRELEKELAGLVDEPFRTAERLDLDRLLGRLSGRLDAAQALLEMLDTSVHEQPLTIHLAELLRQHLAGAPSGRRPQRRFDVSLFTRGPVEADVKPRALSELVAAELELLTAEGVPGIELVFDPKGHRIVISKKAPPGGEALQVWGYGVISPSEDCVRAAASVLRITREASNEHVTLSLPG